MNSVICLSGGIASGKTTLASAIAERLGVPHASFGRFVRATADGRQIPQERENLQSLGEALISELGWEGFCRAVLNDGGWQPGASIVVDGVRHVTALTTIKNLVEPIATKLIFIDVPRDVREARIEGKQHQEATTLAKADAHATEKDVHGALRNLADLVLDGTRELMLLVDEIQARIEKPV